MVKKRVQGFFAALRLIRDAEVTFWFRNADTAASLRTVIRSIRISAAFGADYRWRQWHRRGHGAGVFTPRTRTLVFAISMPVAGIVSRVSGRPCRFNEVNLERENDIKRWIAGIGRSSIHALINNAASDPEFHSNKLQPKLGQLFARNLRAHF
jgi:hypothetical protein